MTGRARTSTQYGLLALACLLLYGSTSYYGIRSPDAEVVFRTARSLAEEGDSALPAEGLPWKGFGTSRGLDGRRYSVFGPLQPLAAAPFVRVASAMGSAPGRIGGVSHYVGGGLSAFVGRKPPQQPSEHLLRSRTAVFNVVVGTATVLSFFALMVRWTGSPAASLLSSAVFAFGTLLWPYTGTFFSEPLAMLFLVLSLLFLPGGAAARGGAGAFLSGLALGLAVAAHLSAVLFVPFLGAHVLLLERRCRWRRAALWIAGLAAIAIPLGWYNHARFGNILETGRGVGEWHYAQWVAPGTGLAGLLLSWGKGLLWFCPAVVLGLVFSRKLYRAAPAFSVLMAGAVVSRLIFLASRSDWHGGFSLGPRYLVLAIPILAMPIGLALRDQIAERRRKSYVATAIAAALFVAQQLYFSLGEIFSFLHVGKLNVMLRRQPEEILYFDLVHSPLVHLLEGRAGPLVLQGYRGSLLVLWAVLAAALAAGMGGLFAWAWRSPPS